MTIRIRYRIPNARLAAGAVSAGQGRGVGQAYDGWWCPSLNFSNECYPNPIVLYCQALCSPFYRAR
jgi:hypothetical protein